MTRQIVRLLTLVVVTAFSVSTVQAQESSTKAARISVEAWLALIDTQKHAASWETAASVFKAAVTQEQWSAAVQTARAPLGPMRGRALKATTAAKPPAAPEGEYLVFQFDTNFEQRASAVETVTAFKEKDGTWRVAGYFIK
jgi:Protein of unknown function (DUF4019)